MTDTSRAALVGAVLSDSGPARSRRAGTPARGVRIGPGNVRGKTSPHDIGPSDIGPADDEGFGLIEIVVSMFMLALLALAFLPLLIQGIQQSAASATNATATQLVQQQMEKARGATTCSALHSVALQSTTIPSSSVDSRGVSLAVAEVVGPCPVTPALEGGTVSVTSTVRRGDNGTVLATASTLVFVSAP